MAICMNGHSVRIIIVYVFKKMNSGRASHLSQEYRIVECTLSLDVIKVDV